MNPSIYCDNREEYVSQYENVGYFPQDQLSQLNENKVHEAHMLNAPLYLHQKPKYPLERNELTTNSYCQTNSGTPKECQGFFIFDLSFPLQNPLGSIRICLLLQFCSVMFSFITQKVIMFAFVFNIVI